MSSSKWYMFKLGDFCEYSCINVKVLDLDLNKYISATNMLSNIKGIFPANKLPSTKTAVEYCPGDILLSNIRPYLRKVWFATKSGGCSNDVLVIKNLKNRKIYSKYLYYYLCKDDFFNYIMASVKGTKMPRGDKKAILKYPVNIPHLKEQKAIANILSSLDEKIETNNKINKNLEEISQSIFKRWFVDFKFPNENGNPYKSSGGEMVQSELGLIPGGWEIKFFKDFLSNRSEKVGDKDIPEYSSTNTGIKLRDEWFKKTLSKNKSNNKIVRKGDLVFGMSRQILNWGVMKDGIGAVSSAYNIFKIDTNQIMPHYLKMYMQTEINNFMDIIKPSSREGQGIDKKALMLKSIYIPISSVLKKYETKVGEMYILIEKRKCENQILSQIRDSLLPKLMSGEIRVPLKEDIINNEDEN